MSEQEQRPPLCSICGEHANEHGAIAGHQFLSPGECCGAADGEHCARQYGICVHAELPRCRHNLNPKTCDTCYATGELI